MHFFLLICILLITSSSIAQEKWSLQESIEQALLNNNAIKQKDYQTQINQSELSATKLTTFLPSINLKGTQGFNFGRSIDPATNQFVDQQINFNQFSTTANLVIFEGFKKINVIKQQKHIQLSSEAELELTELNIKIEVAHQFYKILFQKELVTNARRQVVLTQKKIEEAEAKMNAGRSSMADVYGLKVQLANEEINRVNLENQLQYSYLNFAALLNIPAIDSFELETPIANSAMIPDKQTVQNHPAVKKSFYNLESSRFGVAAARGDLYPQISLFGSLSTLYSNKYRSFLGYTQEGFITSGYVSTDHTPVVSPNYIPVFQEVPFWDQLDQNLNKAVGVTLSFNIFNGLYAHHTNKQAQLRYLAAKELHEESLQQVNMQVRQVYHDYLSSIEIKSASAAALEQAKLQYEAQELKYSGGDITLLEFLQAKNDLSKANAEFSKAIYELEYKAFYYNLLKKY